MAPAATHPATVQCPLPRPPGAACSQCLPVRGARRGRRASCPLPGHDVNTDCALGLRGLCPVPRGVAGGWGRSTGILLELAHCGPSRDMGTDGMLFCSPAAGGERGPAVSCGDLGCGALFGRSLRVAGCRHRRLPWTPWLSQERGMGSRCCPPDTPLSRPPLPPTRALGLRDHRKATGIGPYWPSLASRPPKPWAKGGPAWVGGQHGARGQP